MSQAAHYFYRNKNLFAMKKIISLFCSSLLLAVVFISCKKEVTPDPNPTPVAEDKRASISGFVFSANGVTALGGVHVYTIGSGTTYTTVTGSTGYFLLKVPAGHYDFNIETGDGSLFQTIISVDVIDNQLMHVPAAETRLDCRGHLAYIPGAWDKIEAIVHDSLGYDITQISSTTTSDIDSLEMFDAIFINCGATDLTDPAQYTNLSQFVTDGGSLYVSDFAASYLTGIHTGNCVRPLGFIDDSLICSVQSGPMTMVVGASIVDPLFQGAMGTNTMNVFYDLGQWEIIQNYNTDFWDVIVSDATFGALMLRNTTYSSNGGNIYYTTFHNNPNGAIGNDMENMLQYVILNL